MLLNPNAKQRAVSDCSTMWLLGTGCKKGLTGQEGEGSFKYGEYKDHKSKKLKRSGMTIGMQSTTDTNEAFKHVKR